MKDWLKRNQSLFLIVFIAFIGGGMSPFIKVSAKEIPPIFFTLIRFLLAGVILLPLFIRKESFKKIKNPQTLALIAIFGAGNVAISVFGIKLTTASISQTLYAVVPIFAGILSYFILKERLNNRKIFGMFLGFSGVLLIIFLPVLGKGSPFSGNLLGNFLVMIAVASFSFYTVLSKKFQKDYSPLALTSMFILITILTQAIISPIELRAHPLWWQHISMMAIIGLLYVGIIGTAFYYLLYQYAIKRATPVVASMVLYLQPIFSFVWAFFLLGEKLTASLIFGVILTFIGVAFVTYIPKKEGNSLNKQAAQAIE